jgi:hypothetical protein
MPNIIKVKCTGPNEHVNEVDIENVLGTDVVLRGTPIETGRPIPSRIVRRCDVCVEGKVIITREMIVENL